MTSRPLRVFLCHSSNDKPAVRELYQKLRAEPWIEPWLDEEELYPGQDWNMEIEKAVEAADAIIVCLSKGSITKEGYIQKEIKTALDFSDYKPEGTVFIIPVRLEDCKPPNRLSKWQYADYFEGKREHAFGRLLVSLRKRADSLGFKFENNVTKIEDKSPEKRKSGVEVPSTSTKTIARNKPVNEISKTPQIVTIFQSDEGFWKKLFGKSVITVYQKITFSNGMEFMQVPAGKFLMGSGDSSKAPQHTVDIPYDYWMARFPVTNELYNAYVNAKRIEHPVYGWEKKKDHPVVSISWNDATAYCKWLNDLLNVELPSGFILRLPSEAEWEKAARGTDGREYPWGNIFDQNKCCTSEVNRNSGTTPVGSYSPKGDSPYGCADMAGNVWERTSSLYKPYPFSIKNMTKKASDNDLIALRGGSWFFWKHYARVFHRDSVEVQYKWNDRGFRVCCAPTIIGL
jgi:formylglycine-generating enzyme required for sulfatase activity